MFLLIRHFNKLIKPAVLVFEAKYYLFYENNRDKATELYNTATVLAEAFGDQVFIKNLKMEITKRFKYRIEKYISQHFKYNYFLYNTNQRSI